MVQITKRLNKWVSPPSWFIGLRSPLDTRHERPVATVVCGAVVGCGGSWVEEAGGATVTKVHARAWVEARQRGSPDVSISVARLLTDVACDRCSGEEDCSLVSNIQR